MFHCSQMNSLGSLLKVCHQLPDEDNRLSVYQANRFNAKTPLGKLVAEVGCEPILHMRHFQVCHPIALYLELLVYSFYNSIPIHFVQSTLMPLASICWNSILQELHRTRYEATILEISYQLNLKFE